MPLLQQQHSLTKEQISRYSRQLIISELGVKGQELLDKSKVLIVGAGGLGCPVGLYLAAAGIGCIGIVDYDAVELSNLHRQVAHDESWIGKGKVDSLSASLQAINKGICIQKHNLLLDSQNAMDIIKNYDLVVDATDNVVTRYLLNDACVINRIPLVSGAALQLDGQLTTYNYGNGPCFRCIFPTPPPAHTITNCDSGGVLGPVPGMIGSLQALEVLMIIGMKKSNYSGKMLVFNGSCGEIKTIRLRGKQSNCKVCGDDPTIKTLIDYKTFCGSGSADDKPAPSLALLNSCERMDPHSFHEKLINNNDTIVVLDVRPKVQTDVFSFPDSLLIPFPSLDSHIDVIREKLSNKSLVVICRRGNNSQKSVLILRKHGIMCKDLIGGIQNYSNEIDPSLPII